MAMTKTTTKMTTKPSLKLGSIEVTSGSETPTRMALLIWGLATCGKTTLSATAPGDKLWLSLGDGEHVSVMNRSDVHVAKLYDLSLEEFFRHGQTDNPFGLDKLLGENENIGTVVFDSATALSYRALQRAVEKGIGASKGFTPSMETPGISAYGGRNAITLEVLTGLLRVTAKHNVHCIITAHEADAVMRKDERGNEVIDYIAVMLGGQLVNNVTMRLSEIWHLRQLDGGEQKRILTVRKTGNRKPMKTRMFRVDQEPQFELVYDSDKPDSAPGQMTLAEWTNQWLDNGGAKLPIPTSVEINERKAKLESYSETTSGKKSDAKKKGKA